MITKRTLYEYFDKGSGDRISGFSQKQLYVRLVAHFMSRYSLDEIKAKQKAKEVMEIENVEQLG